MFKDDPVFEAQNINKICISIATDLQYKKINGMK
jgi:hypothetical protein